MNKIKVGVCFSLCSLAAPSMAQYMWQEEDGTEKIDLREDIQYGVEMQGSFSKGKTPLWLNANKHGLSSLEKNNGYLRGSLVRPLSADFPKSVPAKWCFPQVPALLYPQAEYRLTALCFPAKSPLFCPIPPVIA